LKEIKPINPDNLAKSEIGNQTKIKQGFKWPVCNAFDSGGKYLTRRGSYQPQVTTVIVARTIKFGFGKQKTNIIIAAAND